MTTNIITTNNAVRYKTTHHGNGTNTESTSNLPVNGTNIKSTSNFPVNGTNTVSTSNLPVNSASTLSGTGVNQPSTKQFTRSTQRYRSTTHYGIRRTYENNIVQMMSSTAKQGNEVY